ncbi:copper amine oxidase N-terminal domain-containing protein [Paenibacillus spongiae]|uniref:Copper amine oxidase N-terminal domain-containing protein n=1 Tax=Paenibacillus spongiae TaxID=2909671 RepID=A0ABY5SEB9_9BACL|nr:copper amine oxidase N-terminal domain-containing protein [Paenibacillus spongiae]UVI30855.1 copper amine oxidase N-terminal domain-containing protein [Paenibacillus spongiae]
MKLLKSFRTWKSLTVLTLAMAVTLSFATAGMAAPASVNSSPILVYVEDEEIEFNVAPVVQSNTVYVEFRSLFEALGYTVNYDVKTKSITGESRTVSIQMKIGSSDSLVNGKPSAVKAKPIAVNGRTLVPLRFIGEASGLLVNWSKGVVELKYKAPTAEDLAGIKALFDQQEAFMAKKDYKGFLSTIDPSSELLNGLEEHLSNQPADDVATVTTFENFEVEEWYQDEAGVWFDAVTKKSGSEGFHLDRTDATYAIVFRAADGSWKLYDIEIIESAYLNAEEMVKQEATVPDAEKTAILGAVEANLKALNAEDEEALIATFDPATVVPGLKEGFADFFADYDLKYANEKVSIAYYKDSTAYVYVVQKMEVIKGDLTGDRTYNVYKLTKDKAGKWLIDTNAEMFKYEEL